VKPINSASTSVNEGTDVVPHEERKDKHKIAMIFEIVWLMLLYIIFSPILLVFGLWIVLGNLFTFPFFIWCKIRFRNKNQIG
jgi:hypothetical protein